MNAEQDYKKVGREKEYMREYMRDRRVVGFDQTKKDNMKSTMKRRERKNQLVEYKGGACAFCGGVFDGVCFDFHHLNPSKKKYDIAAEMLKIDISELKKELKKCIMLCANCHRVCHKIMQDNRVLFLSKTNAVARYKDYQKAISTPVSYDDVMTQIPAYSTKKWYFYMEGERTRRGFETIRQAVVWAAECKHLNHVGGYDFAFNGEFLIKIANFKGDAPKTPYEANL